ncbi:hypothetical protein [Azospirillum sp. ST 5-10]|uniref:hypothetical protein n=1 Tax=unclassified Azospirillum TaxID=2630922 RepID=UPI003F4A18F2
MRSRRFAGLLAGMMAGLLIWAAHLAVVYAFTALGCARGFAGATLFGIGLVPAGVALATLLALAAAGLVAVRAWRGPWPAAGASGEAGGFVRWMTAAFAGLSWLAILWIGLPALQVPACG